MIIKLKNILFAAAVVSLAISSCSSDSSDVTVEQNLGECLTYSKNAATNAQNFNRISFLTQFNYANYTVDFGIIGLELPTMGSSNGMRIPKVLFNGLPWAYDKNGWKVLSMENVTPEITGVTNIPLFKKLNFMLLDVFDNDRYAPGIIYDFEIEYNGETSKVVGCCMTGKTTSVSPDGNVYSPESDANVNDKNKPVYWIDYDFVDSKADVYLFNAKFISTMPSINMVFPNVDMSMSNGVITLEAASLIPEFNGVPYPSFPVTQLKGTVDFKEGMNLAFHCAFRGTDYSLKFEGEY